MKFWNLLITIMTTNAFVFTPPVQTMRKTIVNVNGFVNETYFPNEDITFVRYDQQLSITKPTIIFIPGLEFSGLSLVQYANELKDHCNMVFVCSGDKPSIVKYDDIVHLVKHYIDKKMMEEVIIVGESFGAVVALGVATFYPSKIKSVMLLNSATAYNRAHKTIEIIDSLRNISDLEYQMAIIGFILAQRFNITSITVDNFIFLIHMAINMFLFPRKELINRVDSWIIPGCSLLEDKLHQLECKVLAVCGENDQMFPSVEEGHYLKQVIPNCSMVKVPCDHLILSSQFELLQSMRDYKMIDI